MKYKMQNNETDRYAAVLQIKKAGHLEEGYILYEGDRERGPRITRFNKNTGEIIFEQKYMGK